MRTNLFRLRPSELELLLFLDDGPERDSVGRMIDDLTDDERILAEIVERAGLVGFAVGWRGMGWYRLTALGRELLRTVGRS